MYNYVLNKTKTNILLYKKNYVLNKLIQPIYFFKKRKKIKKVYFLNGSTKPLPINIRAINKAPIGIPVFCIGTFPPWCSD